MAKAKTATKTALTDYKVKSLKHGDLSPGERLDVYDANPQIPGFLVRVSHSGLKTFLLSGRVKGEAKVRQFTLGRYVDAESPAAGNGAGTYLTLAQARAKAARYVEMMRAGINPQAHEEAAREADKAAKAAAEQAAARAARDTFLSVADAFLKAKNPSRPGTGKKWKPGTYKDYERILVNSADLEEWRKRPIAAITRRDVKAALEAIETRSSSANARLVYAVLSSLFNWAAEREIIEASPLANIKSPEKAESRSRVLSDDELRIVFECISSAGVFAPPFKLLALTGQRKSEICDLRFAEVHNLDGDTPYLELPPQRTKNSLKHIVPLSPMAASIVQAAMSQRVGKSPFVFSTTGETPISGDSKAKARLDAAIAEHIAELKNKAKAEKNAPEMDRLARLFVAPWTIHDLRRTFVTGLNNIGIAPHVVESAVNHVSGAAKSGVAGVYNHALYLDERRAAMNQWAAHVAALLDPDMPAAKVIPMRKR